MPHTRYSCTEYFTKLDAKLRVHTESTIHGVSTILNLVLAAHLRGTSASTIDGTEKARDAAAATVAVPMAVLVRLGPCTKFSIRWAEGSER